MKDQKVKKSWDPKNKIEDESAKKFRQHHLPVSHRGSHKRLDCSQLKFLREQPHGDEREDQDKSKPEKDRVKKCFLHRILHWSLIHERNLEIEVGSAHEQKEDQDDVGDGRVEIARYFARKKGVKFTHGKNGAARCLSSRAAQTARDLAHPD